MLPVCQPPAVSARALPINANGLSARIDVRLVSGPVAIGVQRECSVFGLRSFCEAQRVRYQLAFPTWEYIGVWITVQWARWGRAFKMDAIPLGP